MTTKPFDPESQIQHLEPDQDDPDGAIAYVCGVPVSRAVDEEVTNEPN